MSCLGNIRVLQGYLVVEFVCEHIDEGTCMFESRYDRCNVGRFKPSLQKRDFLKGPASKESVV